MDEGDKIREQISVLFDARSKVQDIDAYRQLSQMINLLQQRATMLSSQPATAIPALTDAQVIQLRTLEQNLTTAASNSAAVTTIVAAAKALAAG